MGSNDVFYSFDTKLEKESDEELISFINQGNQEALEVLLKRYKELVTMKISKYFIIRCRKRGYFSRRNDRFI